MSQPTIRYLDHSCVSRPDEVLLDTMLRAGWDMDFSCRSGVCRRCMLRVTAGNAPDEASRKLPEALRDKHYVLACQCHPTGDLTVAPKRAEDMVTACMLTGPVEREGERLLALECVTEVSFSAGRRARLSGGPFSAPVDVALAGQDDETGFLLCRAELSPEDWTRVDDAFGADIVLHGPYTDEIEQESEPLPPEPELWAALGNGSTVRAVLETFYRKVFADPLLRPFFERVTIDRVIGKQYSFLMQSMLGEPVYIGERPKNAHHWMVISDEVFDHRQQLMAEAQREHGMSPELMARWYRHEEHFRRDIVKHAPWPKRVGDQVVDTERFESLTLEEATVCDYCQGEIDRGTTVRYHFRLGRVACRQCEQSALAAA